MIKVSIWFLKASASLAVVTISFLETCPSVPEDLVATSPIPNLVYTGILALLLPLTQGTILTKPGNTATLLN